MFRCIQIQTPAFARGLRGIIPEVALSLEQRLASMNPTDAEIDARVDIGFSFPSTGSNLRKLQSEREEEWNKVKRNHDLQAIAKKGQLRIDLDKMKSSWVESTFRDHVFVAADHYSIYRDLFDYGFFYPALHLKVNYPVSENESSPVHFGNIISPADTLSIPEVSFAGKSDSFYTLALTSLDSHLEDSNYEYLHWMVTNIPGGNVSQGVTLCDYLAPFVPKGTGYHRFAFVLYEHDAKMDFSEEKRTPKTACLKERTFRTLDFYRSHQDKITPCGLTFFQSTWDDSLTDVFHHILQIKVPVFEHIPLKPKAEVFQKYPLNVAFNEYIDKFRDPKEIAEEIYCKRLKKLDPFIDEPPPLKFPHAVRYPDNTPSWVKTEITKERDFDGKFKHMKRFSLYPEGAKKPYKGPQK